MTPDTTFRASLEHHPRSSENHSLEKVTKSPNFSGGSGYSMAGAEGFEPSARGFGVAVEVYTLHKTSLVSQTLADLHRFTFRHSDAFLMLLPNRSNTPATQNNREFSWCLCFWQSPFFFFSRAFWSFHSLYIILELSSGIRLLEIKLTLRNPNHKIILQAGSLRRDNIIHNHFHSFHWCSAFLRSFDWNNPLMNWFNHSSFLNPFPYLQKEGMPPQNRKFPRCRNGMV